MKKHPSRRLGFTLIETVAVLAMISLLAGMMMPAVQRARTDMRGAGSAANLALIGQGSAMYGQDHQGRLFTYTWAGPRDSQGVVFFEMSDGTSRPAASDDDAAQLQNWDILMRRTGRIDGPDKFVRFRHLPHRRYSHLVLMDYLGTGFPSELFADPADAKLRQWQANPTDLSSDNDIPYAAGSDTTGYMPAVPANTESFASRAVWQRWAFGSSYQRTVSAWSPDGLGGEPTVRPIAEAPHVFAFTGTDVQLAEGRNYAEVAFPSAKVHMFEEFDREQPGDPYFAYDHARPEKLMFDGSVNDWASGDARASWNPANGKQEWRQAYVPLHEFPVPLGGLGDGTLLSQRYRWTLGGLRGIDYAAPLIGGRIAR